MSEIGIGVKKMYYHPINQSTLSLEHDNSCILFNKSLWRAYYFQGTSLGATRDKKMNEVVPVCKGLTIRRTEPNLMANLRYGFTETLIFEMCLESNIRGEKRFEEVG